MYIILFILSLSNLTVFRKTIPIFGFLKILYGKYLLMPNKHLITLLCHTFTNFLNVFI